MAHAGADRGVADAVVAIRGIDCTHGDWRASNHGGDTWLRRLRLIGIALPVLFIAVLELIRLTIIDRMWPGRGHLLLAMVAVLAAVAFGTVMFFFIDRAYRLVFVQNRQLTALNAVSAAVRGDLGVDQIVEGAMDAILASSGAAEVTVAASAPAGRHPGEDVATWYRGTAAGGIRDDRAGPLAALLHTVDVPLLAGTTVVGTMSLRLPDGGNEFDRLTAETLQTIGQQLGNAMQRAQLIADLRRRRREGDALYEVLLLISNQSSPTSTLVSVVDFARNLLGADDAGLCLNPSPFESMSTDAAVSRELRLGEVTCIAAEGAQPCDDRLTVCPVRTLKQYPVSLSVPLRGPAGSLGQTWLGRRSDSPFSSRDERFLITLSELAIVALDHARMVENERQGAILAERLRIAREMHDSLAQVLGVTQLRLRSLTANPKLSGMTEVEGELRELIGICQEAYCDVREAILGLRESSRVDRALLESLRIYVERFSRQSGVETTIDSKLDHELALPPQCEVQVIRVIQEALTNVRKHSGARSAVVRISETPESTTFVVEDDGHGFDPGTVLADREGFGLHSMRERMRLVNGRIAFDSARGRGTRVVIGVPVHRPMPPLDVSPLGNGGGARAGSRTPQSSTPIRVLLVDDQPLLRHALAALIDEQDDLMVVGEAETGLEGVEKAYALMPDLVVMDVEMPVMDGVEAARLIREQLPAIKVIMLTVSEEDDHLFEAIRAGAHGYLLKDLRPEQLYEMLRSVMRDQTPVSPALAGRLLTELREGGVSPRPSPQAAQGPAVSRRELEILQLVADGLSNKEIGRQLSITEGTVKNHIHNALRKLQMENRIQAAAYIVRQGLGRPAGRQQSGQGNVATHR